MYSAKSHLEDVVDFFKPCITECKIIDGGMIQLLQFIDTHIKKPFKHILRERERWADWIANGTEEFSKQDNRWLDTILHQVVPTETILEVSEMLLELEKATIDVVNQVHEDVNTEDNEKTDDESENSSDEEDIVVE